MRGFLIGLMVGLSLPVWAFDMTKYSQLKDKGVVSIEVVTDAQGKPVLDEQGKKQTQLVKQVYDKDTGAHLGQQTEDTMSLESHLAYLSAKSVECHLACDSWDEAIADVEAKQ